ncbi:MAG TPA: hypothetical protein VF814_00420 [Casimicrobiaceae bacterium]
METMTREMIAEGREMVNQLVAARASEPGGKSWTQVGRELAQKALARNDVEGVARQIGQAAVVLIERPISTEVTTARRAGGVISHALKSRVNVETATLVGVLLGYALELCERLREGPQHPRRSIGFH